MTGTVPVILRYRTVGEELGKIPRPSLFTGQVSNNSREEHTMELLDMLKKSRVDFSTFNRIVEANIPINETIIGTVAQWYQNVEIRYPIAEMQLGDEERATLAKMASLEMSEVMDSAISELEAGGEEREVLQKYSPKLDALWREIAGIYAGILNETYAKNTAGVDAEEARAYIQEMIQMMARVQGEDEDAIKERMRHDASIRTKLRQMGIDPDAI